MKSILAILLAGIFLSGLYPNKAHPSPIEVPDASSLPILSPDLASRKTMKLRLNNGLGVLLISDEKAELSAASVAVGAGSWNDPEEYPGMAHFCEHMLFMGTAQYPDENEFLNSVACCGGITNAMTSSDRTVYIFSANEDGFLPLLEKFAHFFIDPLFQPAHISRELHAVNQEFAKNIENDDWRAMMVLKETGNPAHPNRMFNCGNSETLSQIPQSALSRWHKEHYSADRMHAVLYSSLSIDTLQEKAVEWFGKVPAAPARCIDPLIPITSPEQRGHAIYVKPIQKKQIATLFWELPPSLSKDSAKAADLVAYTLARGDKNNLRESLKAEGWIEDVSIHVDDFGGVEHRFFEISLELTDKGMERPDAVILRVFQTLTQLRSTGIPLYLFQEKNTLAQLKYQYQSRKDPFSYAMLTALSIPDEPLETYPRDQLIAAVYSPQKIAEAIGWLTPERCIFLFLGSPPNVAFERRERWLGAEYTVQPIPERWMSSWNAASACENIHLPEPNPFVPNNLRITPPSSLEGASPLLLAQNELGTAYYARLGAFKNPESAIYLHLLSAAIDSTARGQVLSALYCSHLSNLLHPTLSAAEEAGLSTVIKPDKSRIHIEINGFNEKASILLQEILSQMPLTPPTPAQFANLVALLQKEYANASKELACRQAKELLNSLVNPDKTLSTERLSALQTIRYEDFLSFYKKLFEKTYIEAFFAGNLSLQEAESAWIDVIHSLGRSPFPKAEHPQAKVALLPGKPYSITQTVEAQGNAAVLLIDEGAFTHPKRAAQELLSSLLKEAFFNELRTKQRTGYIAASDCLEIEERLFQLFLVQSNSHQPEELLYRFELFLEEFLEDFSMMAPKEKFDALKQAVASSIKNRFCNLKETSAMLDLLAFQYRADFQFMEKRIQGIENLSYEEFRLMAQEFLSRANKKRLAVLFEGKIASPFAYQSATPQQISSLASYTSRPEKSPSESADSDMFRQ